MSVEMILALIAVVESDDAVKATDFLTDGDDSLFPDSLKALVDHFDQNFVSRFDAGEIEKAGYTVLYGDCICIRTKKGIINTGSDNL